MDKTTIAPTAPLAAHRASASDSGAPPLPPEGIHLGRERVSWSPEVWERIDRAVREETQRTCVTAKFLPQHRVDPRVTTVPSETVLAGINSTTPFSMAMASTPQSPRNASNPPILNIDEGSTIRLIKIWVEFSLTAAQVEGENDPVARPSDAPAEPAHQRSGAAATLAGRAANILSLAQDTVVFQGSNAIPNPVAGIAGSPLFSSQAVLHRGIPMDTGLLCIGGANSLPTAQILPVSQVTVPDSSKIGSVQQVRYSENTVAQINSAYSILSGNGYTGPFVCVLHSYPFADTYAPLPTTLILPADRIKPLMEEGYYGSSGLPGAAAPIAETSGLPTAPQSYGVVISLGGSTVDLVNGLEPVTAFSQVDATGNYIFRVLTRFALRLKDPSAIIRLEFQ